MRGSGRFLPFPFSLPEIFLVSIPFIAVQWSLRFVRTALSGGTCNFNPLHCGAVVASKAGDYTRYTHYCFNPLHCGAVVASVCGWQWPSVPPRCFNPLHCGAVVASRLIFCFSELSANCFNPLHCGAVVASRIRRDAGPGGALGFNPLHCGAVVASFTRRLREAGTLLGFNPLHCGAVVASRRRLRLMRGVRRVSIPFIAGQWSLQALARNRAQAEKLFQSPSLRGSGRFGSGSPSPPTRTRSFNPLHCGAVVASRAPAS